MTGRDRLSQMKIIDFALEWFFGPEMYVERPPISSSLPAGWP